MRRRKLPADKICQDHEQIGVHVVSGRNAAPHLGLPFFVGLDADLVEKTV